MKSCRMFLAIVMMALMIAHSDAAGTGLDDLNIHGFVSQGFLYTTKDMNFLARDTEDGTFDFNEMAVNFAVSPMENLRMGMQLNAFDLGDVGNDEMEVDWAYGDYSLRDYLGVQAGIMKIPFGLYNEVRKVDMVRTSILLPTSVYPEWFRETFARIKGVSLYGTLPGNISYQAMYGDIHLATDGGLTDGLESLLDDLGMDTYATDTDYAYAGRLQWESPFGLKLAASLYVMDGIEMYMNTIINLPAEVTGGLSGLTTPLNGLLHFEPLKVHVFSAEYMADRLTVAAEYCEYDLDFMVDITSTMDPALVAAMGIPLQVGDKTTMQGYYGSIAYRLLDQLEVGAYYSEVYYDKSDHDGKKFKQKFTVPEFDAWLKEICLSARYDFSANWCAKIEGHFMDGSYLSYNANDRNWELYAAKVTYSF